MFTSTFFLYILSVRAFNQFTPLARTCESHPLVGEKWLEQWKTVSYFESLEAKAKERYREKLSCVGSSIQDDPYLPKNDARFVKGEAKFTAIYVILGLLNIHKGIGFKFRAARLLYFDLDYRLLRAWRAMCTCTKVVHKFCNPHGLLL